MERIEERMPNGQAVAAMFSVALGSAVYGLLIVASEVSAGIKTFLTWYKPAGALSGKTGLAVIIWLVSWFVLNRQWKGKDVPLGRWLALSLALIVVGVLLSFPPFFELFA